jgi:hypothetical protein
MLQKDRQAPADEFAGGRKLSAESLHPVPVVDMARQVTVRRQ